MESQGYYNMNIWLELNGQKVTWKLRVWRENRREKAISFLFKIEKMNDIILVFLMLELECKGYQSI